MPLNNHQKEVLDAYERGATAILRGASIGFDENYAEDELITKERVLWILEQSYLSVLEIMEITRDALDD